jgi:hypothetical protein
MSEMDADSNGGPSSDVSRGDSESLSDGEGSMACSDATENSVQDSRKRTRPKKHKLRERPGFLKARSPLICYPPIQIRRPVWMAMLKMIPIFNF